MEYSSSMCKHLANAEINVSEERKGMAIAPQNMPFYFDILCVLKSPTGSWPPFAEMLIRNEHRFYSSFVTYVSVQGCHLEYSRRNGWRNVRKVLHQSGSSKPSS
jgi:hypothetical protein